MATFIVSYPMTAGATFDADYYLATHMPLVQKQFGPHGMTGVRVLFPDQPDVPLAAIAVLDFADGASLDAALADPASAAVFADIVNFTTIQPVAMRARDG